MIKCLSIKNPYSYLICVGLKDVENRTWTTKYRGRLYIHSSGENSSTCYDSALKKLLPVHDELKRRKFDKNDKIINADKLKLIGYDDKTDEFYLKSTNKNHVKEYNLIKKYKNIAESGKAFFKSQAIIGHVDLVDIIQNSKSEWAQKGQYHWIVKNPKLFDKPYLFIKGKLKIFDYDLREA
jgi:hypothetical protein